MIPVVILCGGQSTRLSPLTEKRPKSMIEVLGKPFIDHQLTLLKKNNVTKVILCIGKYGDQIWDYVKDGLNWGLSVKYSDDGEKLLGTGGALLNARPILPDEFIVMNGDSYLDIDYNTIVTKFHHKGKPILMTVYPIKGTNFVGNVCVRHNKIVDYNKSGKNRDMNYIDYGITPMKKWLLDYFPSGDAFDFGQIYSQMIQEHGVSCYQSPKIFHEIGTHDGLEETIQYMKTNGGL
jgi:N-acetyl-alpha-D-muramate 1-phosphate uridylyltransferase